MGKYNNINQPPILINGIYNSLCCGPFTVINIR